MIGFTCLGDVMSKLDQLGEAGSSAVPPELLANTVTTFMLRGLFTNVQFPYAFFPSRKPTGFNLFYPLWEAVSRLERIGFKVCLVKIFFNTNHVHAP